MRKNDSSFIMKPKVDFCFKELMEDAEIRRGFISAVLNVKPEEIAETILLPTHLRKIYAEEKLGILDVRVRLFGEYTSEMDIEIQVAPFEAWAERTLYYLCKMFTDQIHEGEAYGILKKCIHVGVLDFVLFEESEEFYSCFHLWEDRRKQKYSDKLEIHVLELPKWRVSYSEQEWGNGKALQNWARFLHAESEEEMEMAANTDPYIEKAYEHLRTISADEQKRLEYEAREKAIRDYNWQMESHWRQGVKQGIEQGMKQGIEQGIKQGMDLGMKKRLIDLVCRKMRKGKCVEEIAEELEEDLREVEQIYQAAQKLAPDYDSELVAKSLTEE